MKAISVNMRQSGYTKTKSLESGSGRGFQPIRVFDRTVAWHAACTLICERGRRAIGESENAEPFRAIPVDLRARPQRRGIHIRSIDDRCFPAVDRLLHHQTGSGSPHPGRTRCGNQKLCGGGTGVAVPVYHSCLWRHRQPCQSCPAHQRRDRVFHFKSFDFLLPRRCRDSARCCLLPLGRSFQSDPDRPILGIRE